MGFIFRTIFWLGLATVIIPPQARLGGGAADVDWQTVDVGQEIHGAAYALWGMGVEALSACDTNPELCKAATGLWETTVATAANLTSELDDRWRNSEGVTVKLAENEHISPKKIQARVE